MKSESSYIHCKEENTRMDREIQTKEEDGHKRDASEELFDTIRHDVFI